MLSRVEVEPRHGYDPQAWYWRIPAIAGLRDGLVLGPGMTVLVGENGSGKSTLVEAIAFAWHSGLTAAVHHWGPEPSTEDTDLYRHLRLADEWPRPMGGCFLRAEAMHEHFGGIDRDGFELRAFDGVPLNTRSHGEGFLTFVESRLTERGLWVLDEPESALSFRSCLRLLAMFDALVEAGSQVLLATHSPLLSSLPGALVYQLGPDGARAVDWDQLDLVRDWRDFLAAPQRFLRYLTGPS